MPIGWLRPALMTVVTWRFGSSIAGTSARDGNDNAESVAAHAAAAIATAVRRRRREGASGFLIIEVSCGLRARSRGDRPTALRAGDRLARRGAGARSVPRVRHRAAPSRPARE